MGCGPLIDSEICKNCVIVVASILFIILTAGLVCMMYLDKIITILK